MLKTTPFHERTAPLIRAQTWRRWAGYQVASAYDPHPEREYAAVRNAAALFDVSPLYKYRIGGRDAARLLDRMVTRDVTKCAVGQVLYTPWCDAEGKVIDDGTISRLDDATFRLTSAEPNLRWLSMNAVGLDVTIEEVSARTAALALQGPRSRTILEELSPANLRELKYFRLVHTTVRDIPVTISRTGYTGDLGYELWVDAERAVSLWDALIEGGIPYGITPAGIWALDIARIAAGAGIGLMWGCMDESVIGIAAALHAAFACAATRYLDLDGSFDLSRDFGAGGFALDDGMLRTLDRPGLGVMPVD